MGDSAPDRWGRALIQRDERRRVAPGHDEPDGLHGQRERSQRDQRRRIQHPHGGNGHERPGRARDEQPACCRGAEQHRQRAFAGRAVGVDVPDVVREQDGAGEEPHRDCTPPRPRRHPLQLHVCGARGGDEPEEHEHGELAQPRVAVRARATRVQHSGRDGDRAHDEEPEIHCDRQREADHGGDAERQRGRVAHRGRRGDSRRGEAERAGALGVGAAHAVGVVVRVVDPDLERKRHDERGNRPPPDHGVGVGVRGGGADEHGRERGAEGPRPRPREPLRRRRHVRDAWGTGRTRDGASRGTPACPPAPPRSCNRGGSRLRRVAGYRQGRRRRR